MAVLRELSEQLKRMSLRESTKQTYAAAWKRFVGFAARLDQHVATWDERLLLFVTYLADAGITSGTIHTYVTGIRFQLRCEGVQMIQDTFALTRVLRGAAKFHQKFSLKLPVTLHLLHRLVPLLPVCTYDRYERSLMETIFVLC